MGCSIAKAPPEHVKIESKLERDEIDSTRVTKLLLLGSGSSGKSTLFKQLKRIHGFEFDENEIHDTLSVIRHNCVQGILKLLQQSEILFERSKSEFLECKVDMDEEDTNGHITTILQYRSDYWLEDWNDEEEKLSNLGHALAVLWHLEPVQFTYKLRGSYFSFPDNMDFFLNKAIPIMRYDYIPSDEDILKVRMRTTGMIQQEFCIQDHTIMIYDVGGQRNERKKWIHQFENVTAVIFVAALNHYNARLFEDEKKNAMHEAIELFDEICNSKWFRRTEMILFLNKKDLFRERIQNGETLHLCFSSDVGWEDPDLIWNGTNYNPTLFETEDGMADERKITSHFEECCIEAIDFIKCAFLSRNRNKTKTVYDHITQATDRNNIGKVFWDVQNMLIKANLRKGGLMI